MTLDPHHFQQWGRYYESVLSGRIRTVAQHDWGLSSLKIDKERLANGEFVLIQCSGVMPDGLLFDVPEHEAPPPPRNVQDAFPATRERLPVYLAIPAERTDGSNYAPRENGQRRETRFATQTIQVPDENAGAEARQIEVARANFQIRFEGEPLEGYATLKIAEVAREIGGAFGVAPSFIPACLRLAAAEPLRLMAGRLLELLAAKGTSLAERQRSVLAQRELSPGDLTASSLLGCVYTYLPVLNHHLNQPGTHPEALYVTMSALAGQLAAYLPESGMHPRDFPSYDHGRLTDCFNRMDDILRGLLGEARARANYHQLSFRALRENLFVTDVGSDVLQEGQLFLVARSEALPEASLIRELPLKTRVAAPGNIDAVLRSSTRALPIEHTHRLPSGLPVDHQANYFQLLKRAPFWDSIQQEGSVAVFLPSELRDVQLQLIAVLP